MGFDSVCNTGLVLNLGLSSSTTTTDPKTSNSSKNNNPCLSLDIHIAKTDTVRMAVSYEPSLALGLSGDYKKQDHHSRISTGGDLYRQDSAASSFSNLSEKRERDQVATGREEAETERVSWRVISDEDDDGVNRRKKLRLTKAQSALLEESFKQHSTLNPKQKQELARELKLRPRQVEVWLQNRRARTKLKQTEVDCEYLKKCCETLTEENRRLQKELQELKTLKVAAQPFHMQLPAATLKMCPSCERIGERERDNSSAKTTAPAFTMTTKTHFFNPFTNPSAAC